MVSAQRPERLLDKLTDSFEMFPMQEVADTIASLVDEAETQASEKGVWAAKKYWTVEAEHYHNKVELLIGSIFVLGQAAITQTTSILNKLQVDERAIDLIPKNNVKKMATHAQIDTSTNLSKIVIINTAANFFKHEYEWSENWDEDTDSKELQKTTISKALLIGMRSKNSRTDNLLQACRCLNTSYVSTTQVKARMIPDIIQNWRECWAAQLYPVFGLNRYK